MSSLGASSKTLAVVAVGCGTAYVAKRYWDSRKCESNCRPECDRPKPSGPLALPIVGNLFQLSGNRDRLPDQFLRWAERYGDVYMCYLGSYQCVVLNSTEIMDEALGTHGNVLADRPNCLPLIRLVYQQRGLEWQNDSAWKTQRKALMQSLCQATRCRPQLHEWHTKKEIGKMIREICKIEEKDAAFCPYNLIHYAVTNIMCSYVLGVRYKYKGKSLQTMTERIRRLSMVNVLDSTTFFPFLTKLPSVLMPRLSAEVSNMNDLICLMEEEITQRRCKLDPCSCFCILDLLLSNPIQEYCDEQLHVTLIDLLVCGTEPVSAALSWAILCMIVYPDIQARCHEEIDMVIPAGCVPALDDLHCLPYVKATIYEVLRRFTVLPLGIPHSARCKVSVGDYCIPSDSIVICNINAIHMNECNWECPENFCPDRFYESCPDECPKLVSRDNFMPFGIGPRSCIGKDVALDILHLLFVSLLHRFDFKPPDCRCDMTDCLEGTFEFVFKPKPYRCKVCVHQACSC